MGDAHRRRAGARGPRARSGSRRPDNCAPAQRASVSSRCSPRRRPGSTGALRGHRHTMLDDSRHFRDPPRARLRRRRACRPRRPRRDLRVRRRRASGPGRRRPRRRHRRRGSASNERRRNLAAAPSPPRPSLETIGMTKVFGSLIALDNVSINVPAGSFHALLGENGAGKSTLVKCIMGFYVPDKGSLLLDGQEVAVRNPRDAQALGVGMVYQHFTLVPSLTAAENLVASRADAPAIINWRKERRDARSFPRPDAVPGAARPAGLVAGGGREAEARNPEAALSQPALPDPRRADLGADAGRGRRNPGPAARHGPSRRDHRGDDQPQVPRGRGVLRRRQRAQARRQGRRRQGRRPLDARDGGDDDRRRRGAPVGRARIDAAEEPATLEIAGLFVETTRGATRSPASI